MDIEREIMDNLLFLLQLLQPGHEGCLDSSFVWTQCRIKGWKK
jgi:hypothetical protein